jgi:glycosyltransferase involved in cell wall biosynthesis
MKKILIIASSPLPEENQRVRPAAGLRTYQFLSALRGLSGVDVNLLCVGMPECYGEDLEKEMNVHLGDGFEYVVINKDRVDLGKRLQKTCDEIGPDIILGVNSFPSYLASGLDFDGALWCDLNGWLMAEAQAQAFKLGSNDYLRHYWKMEDRVLRRADKISVVSRRQGDALLGELARVGRLGGETFGYRFIEHVPNGTQWFPGEKKAFAVEVAPEICKKIKNNACNLLWLGGYNTWVDEDTLFKGLNLAMERCEKLRFVSTGGGLKGLDGGTTFGRFMKAIEESGMAERCDFLGWVETEDIPQIYRHCDVGLNVDRDCVETWTGARNRLNEMMKFGMPVVTTLGSEIAGEVVRVEAGLGVKSGDAEELAAAIVTMYEAWEKGELENFGEQGRRYIEEDCNYENCCRALVQWLKNEPERAPDFDDKKSLNGRMGIVEVGFAGLKGAWRYLRTNGLKKFLKKLWQRLRG